MEGDITIGQLVEVTLDTMSALAQTVELPDGSLQVRQDAWLRTRAGERGLVVGESDASSRRVHVLIGGVPREIRRRDLRPLEGVE